jgi:hypothetical protein
MKRNAFILFVGLIAIVGCTVLTLVLDHPTDASPFSLSIPRKASVFFTPGFTAHLEFTDANGDIVGWFVSPDQLKPMKYWDGSTTRIKMEDFSSDNR